MVDFVHQKVIAEPPVFGQAILSQQVDQPEVAALGRWAVQALGFRQYICNPQFKYDPRDGELKFMELNPRPAMNILLPTASGVNLPCAAYQQFLGRPIVQLSIEPRGVSWVMDLTTPNGYKNLGVLLLAQRRRYFRHPTFAFFSTADPKPFFYALMTGVQEVRNKLTLRRMSG